MRVTYNISLEIEQQEVRTYDHGLAQTEFHTGKVTDQLLRDVLLESLYDSDMNTLPIDITIVDLKDA